MRFLVLRGALLLFVLRVVAGACVGRRTGQPRMPPRERLHEGVGFLRRREGAGNPGMMAVWGNCFIRAAALCPAKRRFAFSPMRSHARLAAEIPDIFIPLARNDVRNDDVFFSLGIAPVSGCVDHGSGHSAPCRLRRDGTRRFWFGGLFHTLGRGRHEEVSSGLRAASGEDGTRGLVFLFGGCSGVGGGFFHTLRSGQPRMPPRERLHEGLGGLEDCFTRRERRREEFNLPRGSPGRRGSTCRRSPARLLRISSRRKTD